MKKISFEIKEKTTLDEFLSSFHISKSLIYKLKMEEKIIFNGKVMAKDIIMNPKSTLTILLPEEKKEKMCHKKIMVVYEDDDILVVNKEAGIIVHSEDELNTLDNMVAFYYRDAPCAFNHCHRLDKDTAGIVVYGKHFLATSFLSYEIENKGFEKWYKAICEGIFKKKEGIIDLKIGRDRHENNKYRVSSTGKEAITFYKVLDDKNNKSLLDINLQTGRTHQIRVHLSYISHPIIGDKIYGKEGINLLLVAYKVGFTHPRTRNKVFFEIKLPNYFHM